MIIMVEFNRTIYYGALDPNSGAKNSNLTLAAYLLKNPQMAEPLAAIMGANVEGMGKLTKAPNVEKDVATILRFALTEAPA